MKMDWKALICNNFAKHVIYVCPFQLSGKNQSPALIIFNTISFQKPIIKMFLERYKQPLLC